MDGGGSDGDVAREEGGGSGGRTAREDGGGGAICAGLTSLVGGREGGGASLGGGMRSASRDEGGSSSGAEVAELEVKGAALMVVVTCKPRTATPRPHFPREARAPSDGAGKFLAARRGW